MRARVKYVVVLGPDGSGKTTIADELVSALAEKYSVRNISFTFGIMPSISHLLGREPRRSLPEGQRDSGMVKPIRRSHAAILAIWYGMDHLLGHWVLFRAKPGGVVVSARSYHDFLYQRAYLHLPEAIPRLFLALGPKPDLAIALWRDPDVIHTQKPELTSEEIAAQYARITVRLKRYGYFESMDASSGISTTVDRIYRRLGL